MDFTLYCDSLVNPIVVDRAPRLSWKLGGDPAGVTTGVADGFIQTSYKICVATCREKLAEARCMVQRRGFFGSECGHRASGGAAKFNSLLVERGGYGCRRYRVSLSAGLV